MACRLRSNRISRFRKNFHLVLVSLCLIAVKISRPTSRNGLASHSCLHLFREQSDFVVSCPGTQARVLSSNLVSPATGFPQLMSQNAISPYVLAHLVVQKKSGLSMLGLPKNSPSSRSRIASSNLNELCSPLASSQESTLLFVPVFCTVALQNRYCRAIASTPAFPFHLVSFKRRLVSSHTLLLVSSSY